MTDPTKDHSRVSPEGRAIGAQWVRMVEPIIAHLVAEGEPDERCKSCAFRLGTVPNGCLQTQMTFSKQRQRADPSSATRPKTAACAQAGCEPAPSWRQTRCRPRP